MQDEQSNQTVFRNERSSGLRSLTARLLEVNIGFSFSLAWVFFFLTGVGVSVDSGQFLPCALFYFFGSVLISLAIFPFSMTLMKTSGIRMLVIIAVIFVICANIAYIFRSEVTYYLYFSYFSAGIGSSILFFLWGFYLSTLNHSRNIFGVSIIFTVEAIILFLALVLFRDSVLAVIIFLLPLISIALFLQWFRLFPKEKLSFTRTQPSHLKSLLQSFSAILAIWFLLGIVFATVRVWPSAVFIVIASLFLASVFKIYDVTHKQNFEVNVIVRILAPAVALAFFIPLFNDDLWLNASLIALTLATGFSRIVTTSAIGEHMHIYRIVPFSNISVISIIQSAGLCLGYVIGLTITQDHAVASLDNEKIAFAIIIVFIVLQSFIFKDNYTPFIIHGLNQDDCSEETKKREHATVNLGRWKGRCLAFAQFYELTPRQAETLLLVAKGYSTSYIMEELCVSEHTVKAHIFAIYRKVNVHSRQDLIEKIETFGEE